MGRQTGRAPYQGPISGPPVSTELPPAKGDLEPFGQPSEEGPAAAERSLSEPGLPVGSFCTEP